MSGSPACGEPEPVAQLRLSPELAELLRAEMREITAGIQLIAASLATANWEAVHETAAQIRASYIMEKSLTSGQVEELDRALPEPFKLLDAEFHARAEKLAAATEARDTELAGFHYARLLETCTRCHAAFARARFPGFAPPPAGGHAH
jgi:cytochrome c556